jgi:hypothetical protein
MARCCFQVVGGALVITALAASAAAQNAPAPIDTLNELEAAFLACWVPPPLDQSQPGTEIAVLLSFKRNGELFGQPRITFVSPEASEAQRSAYRTAVTETLRS